MIRKSRLTSSILGAVFTCLVGTSFSWGEATKEIWSDAGFYNENSNFLLFDGVLTPPTLDFEGEPDVPEGVQTIGQFSPAGQYVGWGFANVIGPGSFTVQPQDFSEYLGGDIRFWLKSDFKIRIEIQYDGVSPNPFKDIPSTNNQWEEIIIPLSDLGATSQRLSKVVFQFIVQDLPVPTNRLWFIDHIRWTKPVQDLVISPTSTQINPGQTRQFTAEGRDSNDELVIVYPTFSTTRGTLNTTEPARSVVLSVNTFSSDGTVTASSDGETAVASVDITNSDISETFGILSETRDGVELGEENENRNSEFLLFSENNNNVNTLPIVSDVVAYSPEGNLHNQIEFRRKTSNLEFQGVFVQWGVEEPLVSKDLNTYHDGSIRFWFKGPATANELRDKLTFSVRSVNVSTGTELSSVLLKDYVVFNDTWQSVVIPISDLVGPPTFADISRMKVFFNLSVAGTLSSFGPALRTIFIDDVRWDTELPGALNQIQIVSTYDPSSIPVGAINEFRAIGMDANGVEVDVFPTWSFTGAGLGTLLPTEGPRTILKASNSPVSGGLRATAGGQNPSVTVNVTDVNFPESFNIHSDLESSGEVIISTGSSIDEGLSNNTLLELALIEDNGAPGDENSYFQGTVTLDNHSLTEDDAFAVMGFIHPGSGRYLENYSDGFIQFSVRSNIPLQISALSADVDPDTSNAVVTLEEIGVANSNPGTGVWQQAIVPIKIFQDREPGFDFGTIDTYFTIGAISASAGEVTNAVFDVDNVKWLSRNTVTADLDQIVVGLEQKVTGEGVLRSFDDIRAVTYDQALAAMAFTLKDVRDGNNELRSKAILDAYLREFVDGEGFFDEYNAEFFSNLLPEDDNKLAGPNAFLLLAALHYAETTGSTEYDAMITGLANWLAGFQDVDGGIKFGEPVNPFDAGKKSTEHNLDCYAAFLKYAEYSGDNTFVSKASGILSWLENDAWNASESRFNVGELLNGSPDPLKALDIYSWAPLALLSDSSLPINNLLTLAEAEFQVTIPNVTTGRLIDGVDFGRSLTEPVDRNDAVWLEGMGQMGVAYATIGNPAKQQEFIAEIEKAVFLVSATGQGLAYATNQGTAFGGGIMNSVDPSVSSMAWYIFAKEAFSPFLRTSIVRTPDAGANQTVEKLFKGSGQVDGVNFLDWQAAFGSMVGDASYNQLIDSEPDGDVDGEDFLRWQAAFGSFFWEDNYNFGVDSDPDGYAPVLLTGTLTPPGPANVLWEVESGPGAVIFEDATALETNAIFREPGVYTVKLTADGGPSDNVTITIDPNPNQAPAALAAPGGGGGAVQDLPMPYKGSTGDGVIDLVDYRTMKADFGRTGDIPSDMNQNNIVDAADFTVWRDNKGGSNPIADINTSNPINFNLIGSASDDGETPAFIVRWFVASGYEEAVVFADQSQPETTVTFNEPGRFEVKIAATDGRFVVQDSLIFNVINAIPPAGGAAGSASLAIIDDGDFSVFEAAIPSEPVDTNWNQEADFNGDNQVDETDLALLVGALGTTKEGVNYNPKYNLSSDGSGSVSLVSDDQLSIEVGQDQATSLVQVSGDRMIGVAKVQADVRVQGQSVPSYANVLWYLKGCEGACGPMSIARNRASQTSLTFNQPGEYFVEALVSHEDQLRTDGLTIVVDSNGRVISPDPVGGTERNSLASDSSIIRVLRSRIIPGETAEIQINLNVPTTVRTTISYARTGQTVKYLYHSFGTGENLFLWDGAGFDSGLYVLRFEIDGQYFSETIYIAN